MHNAWRYTDCLGLFVVISKKRHTNEEEGEKKEKNIDVNEIENRAENDNKRDGLRNALYRRLRLNKCVDIKLTDSSPSTTYTKLIKPD